MSGVAVMPLVATGGDASRTCSQVLLTAAAMSSDRSNLFNPRVSFASCWVFFRRFGYDQLLERLRSHPAVSLFSSSLLASDARIIRQYMAVKQNVCRTTRSPRAGFGKHEPGICRRLSQTVVFLWGAPPSSSLE